MKKISLFLILIGLLTFLMHCSCKSIFGPKINPNVTLEAFGSFPYVNFKNESSYGHYFSGPDANLTGVTFTTYYTGEAITRKLTQITWLGSHVKSYNENRTYENGGTYTIRVYSIQRAWVEGPYGQLYGVTSFKAEVDDVEYSGFDKRYPLK